MKSTINNLILIVFLSAATVWVGCGEQLGLQPSDEDLVDSPDEDLVNPGIPALVSSDVRSPDDLIWAKTTNEIIWPGATSINAINAQSHSQRTIYNSGPAYNLKMSHDGNSLFYIHRPRNYPASDDSLFSISLNGQNRQFLFTNVNTYALAPFDEDIAYSTVDGTLLLYDLTDNSTKLISRGHPVIFSPDGEELIFEMDSGFYIYNQEDDFTETFLPDAGKILSVYWTDESFRIVEFVSEDVFNKKGFIREISTNDTLYTLPFGTDDPKKFTWSPDGNKVAFWIVDCLNSNWSNCGNWRYNLWLADVTSQRHVSLGSEVTPRSAFSADLGAAVFSPDNTQIALVVGINSSSSSGSIYVQDLP